MLDTMSVYFGKGSIGGADIIHIDTEDRCDLEEKRLALVVERQTELQNRANKKTSDKVNRIKKKDFERFGIYSCGVFDYEIYLNECVIDGETIENVWLSVRYSGLAFRKDGLIIRLMYKSYYQGGLRPDKRFRIVKYPKKLKHNCTLTKDEVQDMFDMEWAKCKSWSEREYIGWIKLI